MGKCRGKDSGQDRDKNRGVFFWGGGGTLHNDIRTDIRTNKYTVRRRKEIEQSQARKTAA